MNIRHATEDDFSRIMEIYEYAREYMASHGNPNQWGSNKWPSEERIHDDIRKQCSYVCEDCDRIVGVFYYHYGDDIDPSYRTIENGSWKNNEPYGVVHRIAGDGSMKGIGSFCINWAYEQCGHLRIDTHPDNKTMQNLLAKLGFEKRGIIHVPQDNYPRFAYEKV